MRNDPEILTAAQAGYDGVACEGMWSSPTWCAHRAGNAMAFKGYTRPTKAHMSRGYSVKIQTAANDFTARFTGQNLQICTLDRHA